MALLENYADIDHGVGIGVRGCEPTDGRRVRGQELAKPPDLRLLAGGVVAVTEDVDAPRAIGAGGMAEVERFGVGQSDDRDRVEAHADREALGKVLEGRLGGDQRGGVPRPHARREAALRDEVSLELLRVGLRLRVGRRAVALRSVPSAGAE